MIAVYYIGVPPIHCSVNEIQMYYIRVYQCIFHSIATLDKALPAADFREACNTASFICSIGAVLEAFTSWKSQMDEAGSTTGDVREHEIHRRLCDMVKDGYIFIMQ